MQNLSKTIVSNVANLSSSTLPATIQGQVVGSGPTSLAGQLAAIAPPPTNTPQAILGFVMQADQRIAQTANQVIDEVVQAPVAPALTTAQQDTVAVHQQVQTFTQSYFQAARPLLYSKGPITPTAFQKTVASKVAALKISLSKTLENLPNSQSVLAELDKILTAGISSLQSALAAIPLPTAKDPSTIPAFVAASYQAIRNAEQQIAEAIAGSVGQPVDTPAQHREYRFGDFD